MSNYYVLIDSDQPLQQLRTRIAQALQLTMDPELERRWPGFFGVTDRASILLRHNPFPDDRGIDFERYRDILCIYPLDLDDKFGGEAFERLKQLRCPMALLRGLNERVDAYAPPPVQEMTPAVQIGSGRRGVDPAAGAERARFV